MSGGAPHFIMCLCLQSRKDVSCSFISSSCAKIYFLLPARNYILSAAERRGEGFLYLESAVGRVGTVRQSGLAIKIEIYIE